MGWIGKGQNVQKLSYVGGQTGLESVGLSRIFPVCKVTCVGMWDQPLQTQSTKHSVIFWALKRQIANYDSQCLSENWRKQARYLGAGNKLAMQSFICSLVSSAASSLTLVRLGASIWRRQSPSLMCRAGVCCRVARPCVTWNSTFPSVRNAGGEPIFGVKPGRSKGRTAEASAGNATGALNRCAW